MSRPPSQATTLRRALEFAHDAVRLDAGQLDTEHSDPVAAIQAYRQSIALLSEVLDRKRSELKRGTHWESEVKRLQTIVGLLFNNLAHCSLIPIPARLIHRTYGKSITHLLPPSQSPRSGCCIIRTGCSLHRIPES